MEAKHTPTPYKVVRSMHGDRYRCVQIGEDEMYTTGDLLADDAEFIVRAVN
jgi:hypothetical protein